MQGRTIPSENNSIQSFPFKNWMKEMEILKKLKIKKLQWIYQNNKNNKNPLIIKNFFKKKISIRKKYKVNINSICADEFIRKPLLNKKGLNLSHFNELIGIINIANICHIEYLIIPFVDNSSIKKLNYNSLLKNFIIQIYPLLKFYKIELHLETDIESKKIIDIIKNTNSEKYIKINIDSGNIVSLGLKIKEEIFQAKNLIGSVHIKDRLRFGSTVPLGYGDVDFELFFKLLKNINYKRDLILQGSRINNISDDFLVKKYIYFINQYL